MANNNPKMDLFRLKERGALKEKFSDSFHIIKELYDQPIFGEEKVKEIEELEFLPKYISNNEMTRAGDAPTPKCTNIWTVDLDMVEMRGHTPFLPEEEDEDRWDHTPILQQEEDIWGSYTDSSSSSFTHSKIRRASPTPETHHRLSSYGLSSNISSSHAQPKQSSTSCRQYSTTQIRPKQGINPRSDDALDLFIPAKSKIQVAGDEEQVSALLRLYSSRIKEKEQTFRVVGENCVNYRSCREAENLQVRWIKHYSSEHKILLVGEGDFSFSAALAVAFVSATNITATSLDSRELLSKNYSRALSNIDKLQSLGAAVIHNVDATNMANISRFEFMLFDRVVYNFPHAGFFNDEKREGQICRHQKLVQLFLENAKKMIHIDGEIHITHKCNDGFYKDWDLKFIASRVGLLLIEEAPFNFRDYPGYRTKYGFRGDKNFNCNPSKTYKFQNPRYRFYETMSSHSGKSQGHEIPISSDKNISKSTHKMFFLSDDKRLNKITSPSKDERLNKITSPSKDKRLNKITSPSKDERLNKITSPSKDKRLNKITSPSKDIFLSKEKNVFLLSKEENYISQMKLIVFPRSNRRRN